jgi:hypothetical protein
MNPKHEDFPWHEYIHSLNIYVSAYKIMKLFRTQQPLKLEKNIRTDLESLEFYELFDACLIKFKSIFWVKHPHYYLPASLQNICVALVRVVH